MGADYVLGVYYFKYCNLIPELVKHKKCHLIDCIGTSIRAFNALLKAGADPSQYPDLIYKIITSDKLDRSQRLNLLQLLRERNALTLTPGGPDNLSPPFYCLKLKKIYLMRYFVNLPGLAQSTTIIPITIYKTNL